MSPQKRVLDLLPVAVVFFVVSMVATYVAFAYILHDPWWLRTVAELSRPAAP